MSTPKGQVSVEKCIAVINILKQAGPIAGHSGKAAEEFQKSLIEFESLCTSVYELQSLAQTDSETSHVDKIKAQSELQNTFLNDLLQRAEQYIKDFEALAPRGRTRSLDAELKWTQYVSREIAKLHEITEAQNLILNSVFQLIACASAIGKQEGLATNGKALTDTISRSKALAPRDFPTFLEVQRTVAELMEVINGFRGNAMQQGSRKHQAVSVLGDSNDGVSTAITHTRGEFDEEHEKPKSRAIYSTISRSLEIISERVMRSQLLRSSQSQLRLPLTAKSIHMGVHDVDRDASITTLTPRITKYNVSKSPILQVDAFADPGHLPAERSRSFRYDTSGPVFAIQSLNQHPLTRDLSKIVVQTDDSGPWDSLTAFVSDMVCHFVIESLWKLLCLFPAVLILIKNKLSSIAAAPISILQDDIRFEDVLGRKYSLQYEYFREWPIFQAMLISRFKDLPGSNQVARGYFRILSTATQERIFDETNWHRSVLPGTSLAMAILVTRHKIKTGTCLRTACGGSTTVTPDLRNICTKCGLDFRRDSTPLTRRLVELAESDSMQKSENDNTKLDPDLMSTNRGSNQQLDNDKSTLERHKYKPGSSASSSAESSSTISGMKFAAKTTSASSNADQVEKIAKEEIEAGNRMAADTSSKSELPAPRTEVGQESGEEEEEDLLSFRRIRVMKAVTPPLTPSPRLIPTISEFDVDIKTSSLLATSGQSSTKPTPSGNLQPELASESLYSLTEEKSHGNQIQSPVPRGTAVETTGMGNQRRSRHARLAMDDGSRFDSTSSMGNGRVSMRFLRSSSHDRLHSDANIFIVEVGPTLRGLLEREDLDGDFQITIDDHGPKAIVLGTLASAGYRSATLSGNYAISNLLQELTFARDLGQRIVRIHEARLHENPVDRLQRYITSIFWENLTHTYLKGHDPERWLSTPEDWTNNRRPRIYIPFAAKDQYAWFAAYIKNNNGSRLDLQWLPRSSSANSAVISELTVLSPGVLALATRPRQVTVSSTGSEDAVDNDDLDLEPYVSPHGAETALTEWHSYFVVWGLIESQKVDLAKSIVNNLCFSVRNYGKVVHTNRLQNIGRSQPPFLTSMILRVFDRIKHDPGARHWLRTSILAAIKEYYLVWTANLRYDRTTGLSKYSDDNRSIPHDTVPPDFVRRIVDRATNRDMTFEDFIKAYNENEIHEPELEDYILQRGAEIESGHFPTQRFGGRAADLVTIDLNSLLYRYELDIANIIRVHFAGSLELPEEYRNAHPTQATFEVSSVWERRAKSRKSRIDTFLWDSDDHAYYDFDTLSKARTKKASATMFWALWAGLSSPAQAAHLVLEQLPRLEASGGLLATEYHITSLLDGTYGWDSPFGWAPHQILAWEGLIRYGYNEDCERLTYRWLLTVTMTFSDYNGAVVNKYNVTGRHPAHRGDGTIGADFKYVNRHGYAWTNASFLIGLSILPIQKRRALGALVPWDTFEKATEYRSTA